MPSITLRIPVSLARGAAAATIVVGSFLGGRWAGAAVPNVFNGGDPLLASRINDNFAAVTPAGSIVATAAPSCPAGTLAMNGAVVDKAQYARLFQAIGDVYGAGTATGFVLPNAEGVFLRGGESQTVGGVTYAAAAPGGSAARRVPKRSRQFHLRRQPGRPCRAQS